MSIDPDFSTHIWVAASPFVGGRLLQQLVNALQIAGLPD
jgi:hypothetical protein